jgi:hypothetical protein
MTAADRDLHERIMPQPVEVDRILVAAGDRRDARHHHLEHRVPDAIRHRSGAPLASQSTISRLDNSPSRTEAARLTAVLVDQAGTTVKPRKYEILDVDKTQLTQVGRALSQLTAEWQADYDAWQKRHLSARRSKACSEAGVV